MELLFLEGVAGRMPEDTETLKALADLYTREGFHEEGLRLDRKLARLLPEDDMVHYNLACSLSLLGEAVGALAALQAAVELGYRDFEYLLADGDLEVVRQTAEFQEWFSRVRSSLPRK